MIKHNSFDEKVLRQADEGNPKAQYQLGLYYEQNIISEDDRNLAIKWYEKAGIQGYVKAIEALARMYLNEEELSETSDERGNNPLPSSQIESEKLVTKRKEREMLEQGKEENTVAINLLMAAVAAGAFSFRTSQDPLKTIGSFCVEWTGKLNVLFSSDVKSLLSVATRAFSLVLIEKYSVEVCKNRKNFNLKEFHIYFWQYAYYRLLTTLPEQMSLDIINFAMKNFSNLSMAEDSLTFCKRYFECISKKPLNEHRFEIMALSYYFETNFPLKELLSRHFETMAIEDIMFDCYSFSKEEKRLNLALISDPF